MNINDWYVLIGLIVAFPVLSFTLFMLCQYWIHYPYGRKNRKKLKQ